MKISAEFDFVTLLESPASRACPLPSRKSRGAWSTVHSVRRADLEKWPNEVLDLPLVAAELTLNFRCPPATPLSHRAAMLADCQRVLASRLVPWRSPLIRDRVYLHSNSGVGSEDLIINIAVSTKGRVLKPGLVQSDDTPLLDHPWAFHLGGPEKRTGHLNANSTVLYGDKLTDATPGAQCRLYVKTTDDGASLDEDKWLCRIEVTLNALALERFGIKTPRDLLSHGLRPIGREFFQMVCAQPERVETLRKAFDRRVPGSPKARRRRSNIMMDITLRNRTQWAACQALEAGVLGAWPFSHLLRYKSVPALTKPLLDALDDFNRKTRKRASLPVKGP